MDPRLVAHYVRPAHAYRLWLLNTGYLPRVECHFTTVHRNLHLAALDPFFEALSKGIRPLLLSHSPSSWVTIAPLHRHLNQAQWLADSDNNAALVRVREHLQALEAEGQTKAKWTMESQLIAQAMEAFGLPPAIQDAAGSQNAITASTAYIEQLGWMWKEDTQEHSLPPTVHGTLQRAV